MQSPTSQHLAPALLEEAAWQYSSAGNKCGVLHALAALVPSVAAGELGPFVRALQLDSVIDPSEDSQAAEERRVLARVSVLLDNFCTAFVSGL